MENLNCSLRQLAKIGTKTELLVIGIIAESYFYPLDYIKIDDKISKEIFKELGWDLENEKDISSYYKVLRSLHTKDIITKIGLDTIILNPNYFNSTKGMGTSIEDIEDYSLLKNGTKEDVERVMMRIVEQTGKYK